MESSLLNDMRRYADSVEVLQEGLESRRWRKEDRALFLYKIGVIYDVPAQQPGQGPEILGRKPRTGIPTRLTAVAPWT